MRKLLALVMLLGAVSCASKTTGTVTKVEAGDQFFRPSSIEVKSGKTTFSIRNIGDETHEFEIFRGTKVDEKNLVDEVEDITPGLTKALTVSLEPGRYTFACLEDDHLERGQKGSLVVTRS